MDLPTHFLSGLAVGLIFLGRPEIAFVVAIGALIPDLDREYWFIPQERYSDEQRHRALFHNVVMLTLVYALSPALSLGIFIHMLEDSFTTVKDRGVEWFYPFTRLAKHGRYNASGDPQPLDPREHVYFYQEDPLGLINFAEPDLRETGPDPVPWMRVYGFALNGSLLDRGFLFGSILLILVWLFVPLSNGTLPGLEAMLDLPPGAYEIWGLGLAAMATLFLAGELDRHGKTPKLGRLTFLKFPVLGVGLILLGVWVLLNGTTFESNLASVLGRPLAIDVAALLLAVLGVALVLWKTKGRTDIAII